MRTLFQISKLLFWKHSSDLRRPDSINRWINASFCPFGNEKKTYTVCCGQQPKTSRNSVCRRSNFQKKKLSEYAVGEIFSFSHWEQWSFHSVRKEANRPRTSDLPLLGGTLSRQVGKGCEKSMVAAGNGPSIANQRQLQYVTWKGKKWNEMKWTSYPALKCRLLE